MKNYLKQNHLSLLIILWLAVSGLFFGSTPNLFGSINRPTTTITNPVTFQQGVTIQDNAASNPDLTVDGTTTLTGELTLGDGTTKFETGTIATTAWQVCTQLPAATSTILWAEQGFDNGLASSTYRMATFATSTGTIGNNYIQTAFTIANSPYLIIPLTTYATSTQASGTRTGTTTEMTEISGGSRKVPPSWYVCSIIQGGITAYTCVVNEGCNTATSSAGRGGVDWFHHFKYVRF